MELLVFGLLVAISGLAALARVLRVPYPILLVLGGLAIGFVPGVPEVELDPDLVLLIFLPPLLYAAAFFSNLRELRANAPVIGVLSIGLVIATTVAVAAASHVVIGLDWPVAFVLGAVVSPSDAVAPASILRRLRAPRRVVTIVEGENLTNDWTALVTYKFAVAAVTTGAFSLADAAPRFVLTGLGGVAVGVAAGMVISAVRRRLDDPLAEITISLLTAYAAYLPAEELGLSGVMAAVTVGVVLGWQASELTTPTTRIQLYAIWESLQFLLNAVLFILVGLQLPVVLESIEGRSAGELAGYGALVAALVVIVRLVFVALFASLPQWLRGVRAPSSLPARSSVALVAWSGMRGAVCLAAALAIPLETETGAPFPERDLVIFLAFCVILVTLVGQGLTLPVLIRAVGIEQDRLDADEELAARVETAFAALDRIEQVAAEGWVHPDTARRVRGIYDHRRRRFSSRIDGRKPEGDDDVDYEGRASAYSRLMREVIGAQRAKLRELRDGGAITDEVRRKVEYDLDLEEARLED